MTHTTTGLVDGKPMHGPEEKTTATVDIATTAGGRVVTRPSVKLPRGLRFASRRRDDRACRLRCVCS